MISAKSSNNETDSAFDEGGGIVWIPGLDHAGIATQVVVERKLKAEKKVQVGTLIKCSD